MPTKKPSPAKVPIGGGSVKVLVEHKGTLGHQKCVMGGFGEVVERVVAGIVGGEEGIVKKKEGGKEGKGPVWDVSPWGEYC